MLNHLYAKVGEDQLASAAECGVVHRDLKPDNLMLTQKGYAKITDFGICHLKEYTLTQTGMVLGSPRFMSPEQVQGLKPITPQSDLFSLGAVFYYLLAGRPPFMAVNPNDLFREIVSKPHPLLQFIQPSLDRTLIRVVNTLLEKNPTQRGNGPQEIALELRKYLLKASVADPAALIRAYVQDLTDLGFQKPSNLDPERIRELMGSAELFKRRNQSRKLFAPIVLAASLLTVGIGTSGWFWMHATAPRTRVIISPATPKASKNLEPEISFQTAPSPAPERPAQNEKVLEPSQTRANLKPPKGNINVTEYATELPAYSKVEIISAPPFADVFLDGLPLGKTPIVEKVIPAGKHMLQLKSRLKINLDTLLEVKPGIQSFHFQLMSNPEGADSSGAGEM